MKFFCIHAFKVIAREYFVDLYGPPIFSKSKFVGSEPVTLVTRRCKKIKQQQITGHIPVQLDTD